MSEDKVNLREAFLSIVRHPVESLILRWNWKSAIFSCLFRGGIFFSVNLSAGWRAAVSVLLTEFVLRTATSGFYGSLLQAVRRVEPAWQSIIAVGLLMPALTHSIEFLTHWLRGTPRLKASVAASVCFTVISTLFNLHAMRHGALLVGEGSPTVWQDLARVPHLVAGFLTALPLWLVRLARRHRSPQ